MLQRYEMHHNQNKKRFNSLAWKKAKKPHFKPKKFNVKEKLELSSCHKNHGPSYCSGTKCIKIRRKNDLTALHGRKQKTTFKTQNIQRE